MWAWYAEQEWFFKAGNAYWSYAGAAWVQDYDVWTVITTNGQKGKGAEQVWVHLQNRTLPSPD